ncbi:hypothetical protein B0H16DRAFT_1745867 [Mycena metata]|uniref:Ribonuclease H1 N-terminal domain-containing protein n=1 Tax=Mycena metata TaxID=1033252 RepID=A0AAD7H112_9AGAR|nr:hypothetical protein B0H16DRAFT_1745867 [Mycena metata]
MPHDLTPAEVAALISPANHPGRLSGEELAHFIEPLTAAEVQEVLSKLGTASMTRQLPPFVLKIVIATQRLALERPPEYDDDIDRLVDTFDATQFISDSLPLTTSGALPTAQRAAPTVSLPRPTFSTSPPPLATPPHTQARSLTTSGALPTGPRAAPTSGALPTAQRATPTVSLPRLTFSTSPLPLATSLRTQGRSYIVESPTKSGRVVGWFEAGSLTQGVPGKTSVRSVGSRHKNRKPRSAAWAVFYGGEVGVFTVWDATQRSITGHGLTIYAGYPSEEAARAAFQYARDRGWTADSEPTVATSLPPSAHEDNPLNSGSPSDVWYGVCRGLAPGVYRSWLECSLNTSGVKGNLCASFPTRADAEAVFVQAQAPGHVKYLSRDPSE